MSGVQLVANAYLDDNTAKIRFKPVPWEGYQRNGLITPEELALIKKVDKQPRAKTEGILLSEGRTYALLYLNLLKKLQRVDTISWILVLIADAITDHDERIPLFTAAAHTDPELPYGPLLRALDTQDDFVQLKAAQILTVFLSSNASADPNSPNAPNVPGLPKTIPSHILQPFLQTLAGFIQSGQSSGSNNNNKRDVAVQCLEALLPKPEARTAVWGIGGIIAGLAEILKHNPGPQMSYQVGFCFWLLTFDQEIAEQINKKFDIIPLLTSIAQSAGKEKVIRVCIATFRNLVTKAPAQNLPAMLVAQLLPFVKNLAARKWSDEDVPEDVQFLRDELKARFDSLTTYDEYTSELSSGHLSWSPVHTSDAFWKENAQKLNEGNYEQLKILVALLQQSQDPTVLAVAAHDVGQYIKHYDLGKKQVSDFGGKTRVMELMTHENGDVRYQALVSVQRLVSQPWA